MAQFAAANLANTIGTGIYVTLGALYLTRIVGFSLTTVGTVFSVTLGLALLVMLSLGRLVDRRGPKGVYATLLVLQCVTMLSYSFVDDIRLFVCLAAIGAIADRGLNATVGGLIHCISGTHRRGVVRALLRSITNIGFAIGTGMAGLAVANGTGLAYRICLALIGMMYAIAAVLVVLMPVSSPVTTGPVGRSAGTKTVLKDRRYITVCLLNGLLALHFEILFFALPLWIALRTASPAWIASVALSINTAMVVLMQIPVSRRVQDIRKAKKFVRCSGVIFFVSCCILGGSALVDTALAIGLLIACSVVYTVGEMFHSGAEFVFSFDLAPDSAQGEYQSAFALARGVSRAAGPGCLSWIIAWGGPLGWVVIGVLLFLFAILTSIVIRESDRPRSGHA